MRKNYADQFPQQKGLIYLNHAAVAPWPRQTAEAVKCFAEENVITGAWHYSHWIETEKQLRELACHLINAPSIDDIALIKNTSEGLSIIASGLEWQPGDNIVTSDQEFPSNRIPWQALAERGVELREANLSAEPTPEDALLAQVDEHTRLLTISSVQYASGLRMDLERLGQFCQQRKLLFCVDAIQSLGALDFDCQANHADFVIADGHKWMLGPEGMGIFYCRPEAREKLNLHQFGWHMIEAIGDYNRKDWKIAPSARRFECGSLNMIGIVALKESLSLLLDKVGIACIEQAVLANATYLIEQIQAEPSLQLLSPHSPGRRSGIVTFKRQGADPVVLHRYLMDQGVVCAHRGGGIRFSPHFYTPREGLKQALKLISKLPESAV
ncbi:aminotransferase class V-fold PLP-dependent enzyme [Nitrosococcus wardiae]|uniref:Aminotransferase class V-fold PLP-dependent enzyme n=1 Tax=Nitrosococcus wardiae TaxID=1814290 RepID=A0A4P7C197_9GAMM|nr:aminotransferase class V-fold PLP-dependent enzyme [Nitrosococcus wardiae]QBQ55419.1 aminotransferase class V-fold PLP-dependent enzyme [Nitrosococcus wardiae]